MADEAKDLADFLRGVQRFYKSDVWKRPATWYVPLLDVETLFIKCSAALAQIEGLKEELASTKNMLQMTESKSFELRNKWEADLAAAKRDAERYQWLKAEDRKSVCGLHNTPMRRQSQVCISWWNGGWRMLDLYDDLDQLIDAARTPSTAQGGEKENG